MKLFIKTPVIIFLAFTLCSCNHVTYTLRSKKMAQKAKPSIVLLDRIIEFRQENNTWPFSKEEFINTGLKYREAFAGFPYLKTTFKVIDNNTMTFSFSEHQKDVEKYKETQRVDLNSYGGQARFYKEGEKFMWKLKMY